MSNEGEIEKKVNLEGFAASLELPEGHQLVLGELPPGTIVEVATWQGTGRPDETTNRFLLSASGNGLQRRERASKKVDELEAEKASTLELSAPPIVGAPSIGSIGAAGSHVKAREFSIENSVTPSTKNSRTKRIGQALFTLVSVFAIVTLVLSLFGISAVVPARGAKTAFGPSTNALVIYKKVPTVSIGNPTVAKIQSGDGFIYIFGPSNSFDAQTLQIETTAGQELVSAKNVKGRAFLAIPFIGTLVKPLLN